MSDRLTAIFGIQKALQNLTDPRFKDDMNEEYIKDMCLAAHSEVNEILNEINWKPWKKTRTNIDKQKYKNEVIDLLHFVLNLALAADMTPEEMFHLYIQINKENIKRQEEEY